VSGNDTRGTFSADATATVCVVHFGSPYGSAPYAVVSASSAQTVADTPYVSAADANTVTFTLTAVPGEADDFNYIVVG
jgi:hypothetical protein